MNKSPIRLWNVGQLCLEQSLPHRDFELDFVNLAGQRVTVTPFPITTIPPGETVNLSRSRSISKPIEAPGSTTTFLSNIAFFIFEFSPIFTEGISGSCLQETNRMERAETQHI